MKSDFLHQAKRELNELEYAMQLVLVDIRELNARRHTMARQMEALSTYISAAEPDEPDELLVDPNPEFSPPVSETASSDAGRQHGLEHASVERKVLASGRIVRLRSNLTAGSLKDRVIGIVTSVLEDRKQHPTKELVEILLAAGIEIGGADPVVSVSAILSRERLMFSSDRKNGWSLREKSLTAYGTEASDET